MSHTRPRVSCTNSRYTAAEFSNLNWASKPRPRPTAAKISQSARASPGAARKAGHRVTVRSELVITPVFSPQGAAGSSTSRWLSSADSEAGGIA